jgi:ABC-type phosphate/phosphonate transport system substrate-binding protein
MNLPCKRLGVAALLAGLVSWAQAGLTFAVNEGVTYRVPNEEIRAKYAPIAADLSKILKQTVTIEPVASYTALRKGLADKSFDLALVHPTHISIGAIKQSGYRLLVVTKGFENYHASFLVKGDSALKSLADVKDRKLASPDEDSITAWVVRATLRDAMGEPKKPADFTYTRYQDAVPFMVENGFVATGATASAATVKAWVGKGGKVLAESKGVPIKQILASPNLTAEQAEKVREYLLTLDDSAEGKKKLEPTKYQGFAAYDQAALLKIGVWLGL